GAVKVRLNVAQTGVGWVFKLLEMHACTVPAPKLVGQVKKVAPVVVLIEAVAPLAASEHRVPAPVPNVTDGVVADTPTAPVAVTVIGMVPVIVAFSTK